MHLKSLSLAALICFSLGSGSALASSCSLGQWQDTGVDMGQTSVDYTYTGSVFTDISYGLGADPLNPDSQALHGGYDGTDAVTGSFTVQFDGSRYCTSDFTLSDSVYEIGSSEAFNSRTMTYRANLSFDANGNITDYFLSALNSGTSGDHHFIQASSTEGDTARHYVEFMSNVTMYGFNMLASESVSGYTAQIGRLSEVPLPATLPLAMIGLAAFGVMRRRARR